MNIKILIALSLFTYVVNACVATNTSSLNNTVLLSNDCVFISDLNATINATQITVQNITNTTVIQNITVVNVTNITGYYQYNISKVLNSSECYMNPSAAISICAGNLITYVNNYTTVNNVTGDCRQNITVNVTPSTPFDNTATNIHITANCLQNFVHVSGYGENYTNSQSNVTVSCPVLPTGNNILFLSDQQTFKTNQIGDMIMCNASKVTTTINVPTYLQPNDTACDPFITYINCDTKFGNTTKFYQNLPAVAFVMNSTKYLIDVKVPAEDEQTCLPEEYTKTDQGYVLSLAHCASRVSNTTNADCLAKLNQTSFQLSTTSASLQTAQQYSLKGQTDAILAQKDDNNNLILYVIFGFVVLVGGVIYLTNRSDRTKSVVPSYASGKYLPAKFKIEKL